MKENFLLILFYSASGSVRNLAHAIADGAEEQNLKVKLRTVPKISTNNESINSSIPDSGEIYCTKEDLINCDGLAIGSPTRFGSMAAPLKYFLDSKEPYTSIFANNPWLRPPDFKNPLKFDGQYWDTTVGRKHPFWKTKKLPSPTKEIKQIRKDFKKWGYALI